MRECRKALRPENGQNLARKRGSTPVDSPPSIPVPGPKVHWRETGLSPAARSGRREWTHFLVFGQFQTIPAGVDDVNRVPWAFTVQAHVARVDAFGRQFFDQFLWIGWPFDVESMMRDLRYPLFRCVEKT